MRLSAVRVWLWRPAFVAVLLFGCGAVLVACGGEGGDGAEEPAFDMEAVQFARQLEVDLDEMERTGTGLYMQVLEQGADGPAVRPGSTVTAHYTGWLPNGTRFDTSRERGEPLVFTAGVGQLIAGWDEGVLGMTPGERRRLVIPPSLGYGPEGVDQVIPPSSPLVFEVEALDVGGGGA